MSAKNLSTVATDIVETYGKTAINTITSYRVGTARLLDFVDERMASAAVGRVSRLGTELRSGVLIAKRRARNLTIEGLMRGTDRAQEVVTAAVVLASRGIERFATRADRIDRITVSAVDMLARAALPAANAVSRVAERVESGSDQLARRIAEDRAAIDRPVVRRKTAVRTKVAAGQRKVGPQTAARQARSARA